MIHFDLPILKILRIRDRQIKIKFSQFKKSFDNSNPQGILSNERRPKSIIKKIKIRKGGKMKNNRKIPNRRLIYSKSQERQQQDESAQAEIPEITVNKQEIIVEAQEPQAPNLDPAKESIKDSIKNSIEQESRSRKRYSVNAKLYNNESRK